MARPRNGREYLLNVVVALDQLGNALAAGDPRWTISARTYLAAEKGKAWAVWLSAELDKVEPGHCRKAYERMIVLMTADVLAAAARQVVAAA